MIVISGEVLQQAREGTNNVFFLCWDNGDVYSLLSDEDFTRTVPGTLYFVNGQEEIPASAIGKADDRVRMIFRCLTPNPGQPAPEPSTRGSGYVLHGAKWEQTPVEIVPLRTELFSRIGGLLETDVLAKKRVLVIGLGSVGSHIALELTKSGITRFDLIDHDRLEVANVVRHVAGLSDVGRYKTKAMAQLIKEKNPYAEIRTLEEPVSWGNTEEVRKIVRGIDIVVCVTDNRPSRLIINRLCVEENRPCVFAGAFLRAYGGQVLFVRPHVSLCYQCFCALLPEQAGDEEISNPEQAERVAYADRPVPIEPGLSTDIAPISLMVVKLVIQELLKRTETTLRSLDDDLVAPWYLWLNRREAGTQYEKLEPLGFGLGGLRILRWYGVDIKRDPGCPVCGDFESELAKQRGLQLPNACEPLNGSKG